MKELESKCEGRENGRDRQFMATVTSIMVIMRQYMGAAFYPPVPMPPMPPLYGPQPPSHGPFQTNEDPESKNESHLHLGHALFIIIVTLHIIYST